MQDQKQRFSEMFGTVEGDLYRMAYIYLKNRDDALDCVQEAAWRCYRSFSKLRETKFFKTWAIRITVNCAKDILKGRGVELFPEDFPESSEPTESVENAVLDRLTLSELLSELSQTERSTVVLKHALGYGFAEIADMLEIPVGTAKTACYRAIEKLRRRYSE